MSTSSSSSTEVKSSSSSESSSSSSTEVKTSSSSSTEVKSSSSSESSSSSYSSSSSSSFSSSSSSSSLPLIVLNPYGTYALPISELRQIPIEFTGADGTYSTVILNNEYSYYVGNIYENFVWDIGGINQYTFTYVGETITQTSGSRSYNIRWDGTGSLFFTLWFSSYADNRTVPFIIEIDDANPVWTLASYKNDIYAGTGTDGILLKSSDRSFWSKIYSIDDNNIKSLLVRNDTLFIGTSPQGKIYTLNLLTNQLSLSQELGGEVYQFISYKNETYAAGGNPTQIYKYNLVTSLWDSIYHLPSRIVTKMLNFEDKMYVFMDYLDFISFDGSYWKLESNGIDTISSFKNITSYINNPYPLRCVRGIKSVDVDGISLVIGSSNYAKVYNYFDNKYHEIFENGSSNAVNYILNLDVGVNLASIDNKVYLLYCGNSDSTATTTVLEPIATTTTTTLNPPIVTMIFPSGGEIFYIGSSVGLQWSSTKGLNDAVKIELYRGGVLNSVINSSTSNNGIYEWIIPSSTEVGYDYSIVLTWLTAGSTVENNTSSSGVFSIIYPQIDIPTTTTTTTTAIDPSTPNVSSPIAIPLLDFNNGEFVNFMMKDEANGGILFATSKGRILGCKEAVINAYLTGNRNVYAEVIDGFGNISDSAYISLFYDLYSKIAEINENKEIEKWKSEYLPSAIPNDRITGTFLSSVIYVKNDLISWRQLMWREDKPVNTEIIICVRASDSSTELNYMPFDYCFTSRDSDRQYGSSDLITRDLTDFHIKGKYLQFKITMTTDKTSVSPSVLDLTLGYSTKFSVYFFTTKFSLNRNSNMKSGMITAAITQPENTEVQFGLTQTNSSDWNDYDVVDLNKFFSLNNYERMKVGIKMTAYDVNYPQLAEFALMSGSEIINEINHV